MSLIIEEITRQHNRKDFNCGVLELDIYLQQQARQKTVSHISKAYVCCTEENPKEIQGYYTLSGYSVLTPPNNKTYAKYPHPLNAVKLARLAVDQRHQGKKLGKYMLSDAILKTTVVAHQISAIGLFVDPTTPDVIPFYDQFGFLPADSGDLTRIEMWLPIESCFKVINS